MRINFILLNLAVYFLLAYAIVYDQTNLTCGTWGSFVLWCIVLPVNLFSSIFGRTKLLNCAKEEQQ